MLMPTRRSHGSTLLPLVLTAILAATALSAIAALTVPQQALGAATYSAKCQANLRAKPTRSPRSRAVLADGSQMYAVTKVRAAVGASCDGPPTGTPGIGSATSPVKAPFPLRRTYVYAASALF